MKNDILKIKEMEIIELTQEELQVLKDLIDRKWLNVYQHKLKNTPLLTKLKEYSVLTNMRISEIIYRALNPTEGKCTHPDCDNNTMFVSCQDGYLQYCSPKCAQNHAPVRDNFKKTSLEKYGTEHPFQNTDVREKHKQTCLNNFGYESALHFPEIHERQAQTKLEKYGHANYSNWEQGRQTCLEKYNVDCTWKIPGVKEKSKQTTLDRYGSEYYHNYDQHKETCLAKFGVDWYSKTEEHRELARKIFGDPEVQRKAKEAIFLKYGVYNVMQDPIIRERALRTLATIFKLKEHTLSDNRIIYYQSQMELSFITDCDHDNIWIENGDRVLYIMDDKYHYYFVDFKIKEDDKYRLVEIKGTHKWYYQSLQNGSMKRKIRAAIKYSKEHNYLPFRMKLNYKSKYKSIKIGE